MPSPRHRHTAVLHDNAMWVYGGMNDLQEKSDFWRFDFGMSSFLYVFYSNGCYCANTSNVCFPLLCICNYYVRNYLLIYVYSLLCITVSRKWRLVRSKPGPGCLHSQCAVKFLSVMMLFGGERDGQALNDMWRFHFGKI